jgi:hypothetical protein
MDLKTHSDAADPCEQVDKREIRFFGLVTLDSAKHLPESRLKDCRAWRFALLPASDCFDVLTNVFGDFAL